MDDNINLTVDIGGTLYFGQWAQWARYAGALTQGKIGQYKRSPVYRGQSLVAFFRMFRSIWDAKKAKAPMPQPEEFDLVALRPAHLEQATIIDELLKAA
jgi:hypothetical protein